MLTSVLNSKIPQSHKFIQHEQRRHFARRLINVKRTSCGRIITPKQSHFHPKPIGYQPIPKAVLQTGCLFRLLSANTVESRVLAKKVQWHRYMCSVPGVRWHPHGAWEVKMRGEHREVDYRFSVSAKFRVGEFGFDRAKELAIRYRKRLEREWAEVSEMFNENQQSTINKYLKREKELIETYGNASSDHVDLYKYSGKEGDFEYIKKYEGIRDLADVAKLRRIDKIRSVMRNDEEVLTSDDTLYDQKILDRRRLKENTWSVSE